MIPVEEALRIVLESTGELATEEVEFTEASGRLLREDVPSDIDMPPFPRSAVDGFALRAADVASPPARLRLVGSVPAGTFPRFRVGGGEAASIMTGAPVPEGADAVQRVEQSRPPEGPELDDESIEILEPVEPGQNVAPRGSEVREGDLVLKSGAWIDPAAVAVAATVGRTRLAVGRRPEVTIVATGDELVHPSRRPEPGQIRNSNGFSLLAQCRAVGIAARYLGVALDSEASLRDFIGRGSRADVLLLSGGVSMGRFDLVEGVLREAGYRILVDQVALKPGKPLVFAVGEKGRLAFGLPGNPVSTMVTFELFVRPALARLQGAGRPERALLEARLLGALSSRGRRRAYLPGWLRADDSGRLEATPIATRGSGDIVAFSKANALLVVPEDRDRLEAGEPVRAHALDGFLQREDRWPRS